MEYFLEQIQTLLPVLGFDFLMARPDLEAETSHSDREDTVVASPIFTGNLPKYGILARGHEVNGEFVVFKGSMARRRWEGVESSYTKLFHDLVSKGILAPTPDDKHNVFTRDYAFASVSAAAGIVSGRSANGRIHWQVEGTNKTYGQWASEQVIELERRAPVSAG
jgi:hypothetical protein